MHKMTELMSDVDNCVDITCLRHNIFILITVICITKQIVLIFYILVMTSSERRCSKVYHLYIEHQIEHSYRVTIKSTAIDHQTKTEPGFTGPTVLLSSQQFRWPR